MDRLVSAHVSQCRRGFTLLELLVVISVITILAALCLPALGRAKSKASQTVCLSNLHQIGIGFALYLPDNDDRFPDRRDLKSSFGYKPWTTWPPSDPRGGWAAVALSNVFFRDNIWVCPSLPSFWARDIPQCLQLSRPEDQDSGGSYWLWRFDRKDDPVPLDNFWEKNIEQCLSDLRASGNPMVSTPNSGDEVELTVDPYFPSTVSSLPPELRGRAVHPKGRNSLYLDMHAGFLRDARIVQ